MMRALFLLTLIFVVGCLPQRNDEENNEVAMSLAAETITKLNDENEKLDYLVKKYESERDSIKSVFQKEYDEMKVKLDRETNALKTNLKNQTDLANQKQEKADKKFENSQDIIKNNNNEIVKLKSMITAEKKEAENMKKEALNILNDAKTQAESIQSKASNQSKMIDALVQYRNGVFNLLKEKNKELVRLKMQMQGGHVDRELVKQNMYKVLAEVENIYSKMKRIDPEAYKKDEELFNLVKDTDGLVAFCKNFK